MKFSTFCITVAFTLIACASGLAAPKPLDKKATEKIVTLTKVWGQMKYYHSEVAAGSINWDSVFVAYVPKVKTTKNQREFDQLMDTFYSQVPAPRLSATNTLPKGDTIVEVFAAKDIAAYKVGATLKQQLQDLYERHLPVKSKYITDKYKEYTLDYVRFLEDPMSEAAYPDEEIRLLALARYWNTINYFYPHKQSMGKNWQGVLEQYIPVLAAAPNEQEYHLALLRLNKEIVDSHSFVSSPVINNMWGPNTHFSVGYVSEKFVITKLGSDSLAKAEDLRVGDVLISINGKPVKQRAKHLLPLMVGSNKAATYRDIANYLLNIDSMPYATIEIQRNGKRLTKKISRYPYQELVKLSDKPKAQDSWREVGKGIFWVDFGSIKDPAQLDGLFTELKEAKTVIMDLRKYPNYYVYLRALPALFPGSFQVSSVANPIVDYPGFFKQSESMLERTDISELVPFNGAMVVLVNESTQSLGESFAFTLSLRPNTTIMVSQTAGTTGNVTWLPLPGGANVAFTGVGERGAHDAFVQRKGVKVTKVVKPTIAGIAAGNDELFDAAVEEARKGKVLSMNSRR